MSRIIAIANQKGGVGKTTTAVNVSACLAESGNKTLLVDSDPQSNATSGLGIDRASLNGHTLYEVFLNQIDFTSITRPGPVENLVVAPSTKRLAGAEIELVGSSERDLIMRKMLAKARLSFDFIIIDCPPSLNILTVNALGCADSVLVPVQCEYYAMEGVSALTETLDLVRSCLNPKLDLEGVLLTMYDSRTNLSEQVAAEIRGYFKHKVFNTVIPRNVRLSEAPSHGLPIILYDPSSRGAQAYRALAEELVQRNEK